MLHASSRFTLEVYTQAKARRARTVLSAKPQRARGARALRWGEKTDFVYRVRIVGPSCQTRPSGNNQGDEFRNQSRVLFRARPHLAGRKTQSPTD